MPSYGNGGTMRCLFGELLHMGSDPTESSLKTGSTSPFGERLATS